MQVVRLVLRGGGGCAVSCERNMEDAMVRWNATVFYRTENGTVDVPYALSELSDLHDFVEAGPHWDTIERIEIVRRNHSAAVDLTVEAAKLI